MERMQIIGNIKDLRNYLHQDRQQRIAFVPTMGNLHAGHLSLVRYARQNADVVVVSVFVNPTQFSAGEDFERYPRTLESDSKLVEQAGADVLFVPTVSEMYPSGTNESTKVIVSGLSDILCGTFRPGHFGGVTSVVTRLFNAVQPDVAIFGRKDFQQLLIIQQMVKDLLMPIEIIGLPTCREEDGLAMSSRNGYLNPEQRSIAPHLYKTLCEIKQAILNGEKNYPILKEQATNTLSKVGFTPDYISIRDRKDLSVPTAKTPIEELIILGAAWLGSARLIDNLEVATL
jgi:pantoate--beta-alanine ligase